MNSSFWEDKDVVEQFAGREPDKRLVKLIAQYPDPACVRALDIGCAGGRNTEVLASRGFDVEAIDASAAMIAHTRGRVAPILGAAEAARRVQVGRMDDLSRYADACFDLVVALGVYHAAQSGAEWQAALSETTRVMKLGATLLVAVFAPGTDMSGEGVTPVAGEPHLFDGMRSGRHYMVEAGILDADLARHGLSPVVPTDTVTVPLERGRRVTVNALYRKATRRAA